MYYLFWFTQLIKTWNCVVFSNALNWNVVGETDFKLCLHFYYSVLTAYITITYDKHIRITVKLAHYNKSPTIIDNNNTTYNI